MSFRCTVGTPRLEGKVALYPVRTAVDLRVYGAARVLSVERRFTDFAEFHAALSAAAGRRLPPLPAKNPFAAFGGAQARRVPRMFCAALGLLLAGRAPEAEALRRCARCARASYRSWRTAARRLRL